jgi:hypothetical protein
MSNPYTASHAFPGLGLVFEIGTNASPISYTAVGEITKITPVALKAETADVTNVQSPQGVKEFIATLVDPGEAKLDLNYIPDDPGQIACFNALTTAPRVRYPFQLTLPPASVETSGNEPGFWNFMGLVTGFDVDIPKDKEATLTITVKWSGLPTFTPEAA